MTSDTNPYAPTTDTNADVADVDIPIVEPPQAVRYRYTPELLAALWTHRTLSSPGDQKLRRRVSNTLMLSGLLPGVACMVLAYHGELPLYVAVPAAIVLLMVAATGLNYRRRSVVEQSCRQAAHRLLDESPNDQFLSERVVTFDATGVRQVLRASESFTRWEAFERLDHNDDYLFVYDSSLTAVVVPRAAFATRGQYLGFVDMTHRLWNNAKNQPKPNAEAV